jgi:hypothetical protein
MKTQFILTGIEITVSAKLVEEGVQFPNSSVANMVHNKFRITVATEAAKISFFFYDSTANFNNGKTELNAGELEYTLHCLYSDAAAGKSEYADFCSEFGYEEDKNSRKIWKACKTQAIKADKLGIDIYEALNELFN